MRSFHLARKIISKKTVSLLEKCPRVYGNRLSKYHHSCTQSVKSEQDLTTLHGINQCSLCLLRLLKIPGYWISSFIPKRIHTTGTKVIAVNCSMHHAKGLATIWMIQSLWLKKLVFHAQPGKSQENFQLNHFLGSNTIICDRTPESCNLNAPAFDWNRNN